MQVRFHLLISGSVQGVGFRSAVHDMARELNVNGWVRNREDGKVEAVFEGSRFSVLEIVDFCRKGPACAEVDDIEVKEEKCSEDFYSFMVKY
ncbi:MAG: acylphosphatase [Candidatus Aenigmarchaeota archaeon]|nr:acylphosphatase [Candidatus Aenigmarchaeota archaeon]